MFSGFSQYLVLAWQVMVGITNGLNFAGSMVNEISSSHGTGGATRMVLIVSTFS